MLMLFLFLFFIAGVIESTIFCVHGGLSPDFQSLDQVSFILFFFPFVDFPYRYSLQNCNKSSVEECIFLLYCITYWMPIQQKLAPPMLPLAILPAGNPCEIIHI